MEGLDCLIVGYAGVDRVIRVEEFPQSGSTAIVKNKDNRRIYFGGNGSNIAYSMASLGCRPYPLMRIGALDQAEIQYIKTFEAKGVITDGIEIIPDETTSVCHLIEDKNGNHFTMSYPGAMDVKYALRDYDDEIFKKAKYGIISASTYADTVFFLQKCRKNKLPIVFAMRMDQESFPKAILKDILFEAEIIFTNEVERELIEAEFDLDSITELIVKGRSNIVVTTLGAKGCIVYEKKDQEIIEHKIDAVKCTEVRDATGAGDAFIAGFMYGILNGKDAATCAKLGNTTSSFVIEEVGCITNVPDEDMLTQRYKKTYL